IRLFTVASLSLFIYDHFLTWDQEVDHVWKNSPLWIKCSFFTSRYLSLAAQIFNIVHSLPVVIEQVDGSCLTWFRVQGGSLMLLLANLELVMMVRTYAIHDQNTLIGTFLTIWLVLCRAHGLWIFIIVPPKMKHDKYCIVQRAVNESKQFGAVLVFNQTLLWILTYWKYRRNVHTRPEWSNHPIVKVVIRDNSWVSLVLGGFFIALLPYIFYLPQMGQVISWYVPHRTQP
ncbi:hypothetical protein AN958_00395, partial [Leucoagaricus sp. SymC.cos]